MKRQDYLDLIEKAFKVHPVVGILGPRQVGKTTLARAFADMHGVNMDTHYFDLESQQDILALAQAETTLSQLEGLIIIDEIQQLPELFPTLRVLVDKPNLKQRYLILGSASRELLQSSSETLAGRIQYIECFPFSYDETHNLDALWLRGGFPKAFLAENDEDAFIWLESYIQTFLERDIPLLGMSLAPMEVRRFWYMLSHYHGQEVNYSDLGRSLGLSHTTLKRYIDLLSGTLMIRQLQPWFSNIGKRQVKSPKLYFRDAGILHQIFGTQSIAKLIRHPKLGASFEGFALEEIIKHFRVRPEESFFWRVHSGAELDLLILRNGKRIGFEIKYSDKPKMTKSLRTAYETLELDQAYLVFNGTKTFPLDDNITAVGLKTLLEGGV